MPALAVPEMPAHPFPELHPLEEKRPMPSLADLLEGGPAPPSPGKASAASTTAPSVLRIPSFPRAEHVAEHANPAPASRPEPDSPPAAEPDRLTEALASFMIDDDPPEPQPDPNPPPAPDPEAAGNPPPDHENPLPASQDPFHEPTDQDLADAFRPLLQSSLEQALFGRDTSIHGYLEPMLRNTVRRAIAEQMESARQFREAGAFDRLAWRLRALVTSRSYDDIVFDRTRRYHVEEAYLLRRKSKTLVSYASHDPARHASPRRIRSTLRLLVSKLDAPDGSLETSFDLPEGRLGLVREGRFCLLVAILRGRSNALVRADLDYLLHQAEERFGERLERDSEAFIHVLQPVLEGCLLIQSPAPPR